MKHTYLILEEGKLWVYLSDEEMPTDEGIEPLGASTIKQLHTVLIRNWKQSAKSYPIDESQRNIFIVLVCQVLLSKNIIEHWEVVAKTGIKIPEILIEIKSVPIRAGGFNGPTTSAPFAFLAEKPVEKEEDLWPSDEEIKSEAKEWAKTFYPNERLLAESSHYAGQVRRINLLKQHYNLTKK